MLPLTLTLTLNSTHRNKSTLTQIEIAQNYDIQFIDLVWRDCNLIFKNMKAMVKSQALVARNYPPFS